MSQIGNELVVWKKNYFRHTMDIYEPRGPKYQCTQCHEIFNTRLSILTHSKTHLKPFCVVCGLYTENLQEMQNHMKNVHRELVEIIFVLSKDENQNITFVDIDKITKGQQRKSKTLAKKNYNGYKAPTKREKNIVSRFGRCINVKIPADF